MVSLVYMQVTFPGASVQQEIELHRCWEDVMARYRPDLEDAARARKQETLVMADGTPLVESQGAEETFLIARFNDNANAARLAHMALTMANIVSRNRLAVCLKNEP